MLWESSALEVRCKGTEQVLVGGWLKDKGFKKDYLASQSTFHNLSSLFVDSRLFIPKLKAEE